jgi:hypothetical protein
MLRLLCGLLLLCGSVLAADRNSAVDTPTELDAAINSAESGQIINVGQFPLRDLPTINYSTKPSGPQFVFSDDPEYLRADEGAAVREKVTPGPVRLYLYHVNGTTETAKKITAVIENLGKQQMTVHFTRYAMAGPSGEYYRVGKSAMVQYLKQNSLPADLHIAAGASAVLDPALDSCRVPYNQLIHGIYDFRINQPARITVLQTNPEVDSMTANQRIKAVLSPRSPSGAGRGLYQYSTFEVRNTTETLDSANGAFQLVLADGKTDPWIVGRDSSTQTPAILKGNYGVIYHIRLKRRSSDGRALALLMWNYRTGAKWCDNMACAVEVNKGRFPAGIVQVPGNQTTITGESNASLVQVFPPPAKGQSDEIQITYTPPGASCLPTPLVFVPVDWPRKQ